MHIYDKTIESSNKIFILKRESTCHDNNLVVKFYYAKQQIVYEVSEHEGSLKMKINFPWSDVSAIRATFAEERSSTLYIEVLQLLLLFWLYCLSMSIVTSFGSWKILQNFGLKSHPSRWSINNGQLSLTSQMVKLQVAGIL